MVEIRKFKNGKWGYPDLFNFNILKVTTYGRTWDRALNGKAFDVSSKTWTSYPPVLSNKTTCSFQPIWFRNYDSRGRYKNGFFPGSLVQGKVRNDKSGLYKGLVGFNVEEIQRELEGKIVTGAKLAVRCTSSHLSKGATMVLVAHRLPFASDTFDYEEDVMSIRFSRNERKEVDLGVEVAQKIASGDISGFGVRTELMDEYYYGTWTDFYLEVSCIEKYKYVPSTIEPSHTVSEPVRSVIPSTVSGSYFDSRRVSSTPKYTIVRSGDGFWTIARRLMDSGEIDVADEFEGMQLLLNLNGFTSTAQVIHPGQRLRYK